jgi:tRNA(Ile)-lysidine synthase
VLDQVLKTISRYRMLASGDRVIAAVSGGADSVCLVHVLREARVNLAGVAHFNHKLRGEASEEDERFVRALAARMELPFYRGEGRPGEGNLEQEARRDRRGFFRSLIRDGVCDRVALAHTRDDQAETVLFRVLRGSGLTGLAGIHPVTKEGLIRPLIGATRGEVLEFLRARSIEWREDASNLDLRFARNRIRHLLLPQLKTEWNPRIVDALANLGDLAYEEEAYRVAEINKEAKKRGQTALSTAAGLSGIGSSERRGQSGQSPFFRDLVNGDLRSMPRALARRAVRLAIREVKGDLRGVEFEHVESVIEMGDRVRVAGVDFIRSAEGVRAVRAVVPAVEVTVPGTYPAPDGASEIRLEPCVNLKADLTAPLLLRGWKPGDHYLRSGKSRDQKLKKMFEDARVPSWQRRFWPILEYGGKIVWAREFGPAEGSPICVTETLRLHQ